MKPAAFPEVWLSRMEEARRQTQRQLEIINRQITRKMTAILPQSARRGTCYRRGTPPHVRPSLKRYRAHLIGLTAERQPEVDALARWLARQDAAIAAFGGRQSSDDHAVLSEE
jgi:hypothetical protein